MGITSVDDNRFWFPLDNASKIFPAIISNEVPVVFRLTAVLKQPVKIKPLQTAILLVEKRFPYYKVQLKEGFFWFYLEHLPGHIPIEVDKYFLCKKFSKGEIFVRVLVRGNRISVEFSHIVTDGGGGLEFLKTILIEYSKACGANIPVEFPYMRPNSTMLEEEYEDAYKRYFNEKIPPMVKRSKAFHLPFLLNSSPRFKQSTGIIPIHQIKQVANAKNVNITVYLVSVYLYVLQEIFEALPHSNKFRKNKRLRIQVPIDLRNIFQTKTMRNFSLFVMPEIDLRLGHYTFDEILKSVFHQIQLESDKKLINKNIARNVGGEKKIYVRGIPLFLKSALLRMEFYSLGTSQYSGVISNMGKINLPPETDDLVDYFIAISPPPNKMLKINCGVIGYDDKLVLSFGNITKSNEFENKFISFLQSQGICMDTETKK
ncbi:MAG: hypothetical protein M0R23_06750 [Bacteroidales bacterium]|nr:hypothetical protein [Bacteroidales bacterium]